MRERNELEDRLSSIARFERELDDAITLVELGESENDSDTEKEGVAALKGLVAEARRRQVEALFAGEADGNDTYIEVHSGAGGTESQDWARMLFRMYARWAERHKFRVEIIEETSGEEAGIKSGTLLVKGHNAHGWSKTESGVHRLVAHLALRFERAPAHEFCIRLGLSRHRRQDRHTDQRKRLPHRHIPLVRGRRPARQHHGFGDPHHAYSLWHRRVLPDGALAAQEPRDRLEHAARASL